MRSAVIIHGRPDKEEYFDISPNRPSSSNNHWLPWLQKRLLVNDVFAQTPEMPRPYEPDYALWSREFERFDIGPETSLVGHSCGGGFIVRWLSEHPDVKVDKVVLVAPWLDPDHTTSMMDFEIDPMLVGRTSKLVIFHSDNDKDTVQRSVSVLREKLTGHKYVEFEGLGHFTWRDMPDHPAFPELLEELLS